MDVGRLRRLYHLRPRGTGFAISNVVFHRVIEQHGVLRHDANRLAHAGLRDLFDVLPGNQDLSALHVVKPEQQSCQRGFAGAGRPDHCHGFTRRNVKTDVVQDRARWLVGEVDLLEAHAGVARRGIEHGRALIHQRQRPGTGQVGNLAFALHQGEHFLQVGQALLDLAVQHTQKPKRNVKLDHEGVDHHQVTQRHAAIDHALGGAPEHGHQASGNDELLAGVEHTQGGLAFQRRLAVTLQVLVVTFGLEFFVVEILDGFVVQQRINRAAVRA